MTNEEKVTQIMYLLASGKDSDTLTSEERMLLEQEYGIDWKKTFHIRERPTRGGLDASSRNR